jgi:hypothetical protein
MNPVKPVNVPQTQAIVHESFFADDFDNLNSKVDQPRDAYALNVIIGIWPVPGARSENTPCRPYAS